MIVFQFIHLTQCSVNVKCCSRVGDLPVGRPFQAQAIAVNATYIDSNKIRL